MTRFIFSFALLLLISCTFIDRKYQPDILELRSFFSQLDDSALTKGSFLLVDTVQKEWKELFIRSATYQKALNKDDIQFIVEQFDNTPSIVWSNLIFDSARIVSNAYIATFKKKTGLTPVYYKFSIPYFSKDK